jgi:tetratricopeptide (TPR) repeat protein
MRYVTPEQLKGAAVGVRGDLYTMGMVMFEMLAGRPPFEAESSVGVMLGRLKSPAPDVRRFRADTPAWLANVIARLLEREPDARFGSAAEVIAALDARRASVPRSTRRRAAIIAACVIVASAAAVGAWKLMQVHAAKQFSHLIVRAGGGIAAVSAGGRTLWEKRDVDPEAASRWVLARRIAGGDREIAIILHAPDDFALDHVRRLSYVDPQTGKILRTVELAGYANSFPRSPARFFPGGIFSTDTNGDGADEIVTSFGHVPEWASFVTMYDPRTDSSTVVFEGYGQHSICLLVDLDGDGRDELILSGFNNGLGWYNAAAALRLVMAPTLGPDRSPDFATNAPAQNTLLWYALLPRGYFPRDSGRVSFDATKRVFTFPYLGQKNVTLTADGFRTDVPSTLPVAQRQAARFGAYAHLREARRLSHAAVHDAAVREMDASVASASRAGEPVLVEAMRKERAQILIAAGRLDEAEQLADQLIAHADFAAEAAYDVAKAFHLHGDLDRALRWYRRGFGLRAKVESGKSIHEFLQGIVFVHAERHAWAEAEGDIARFRATFPNSPTDSNGMYREFLRWRSGQPPTLVRYDLASNATDVMRYWTLEFRHAHGDDPKAILRDVEREIAAGSSETQSAMWSLRAELLMKAGRTAEARDAVVHAMALLADDIGVSLIARAHAELVRERAARLSEGGE